MLVRTGRLSRARREGWQDYAGGDSPGLSFWTAGWLHRTEIAAIATDTWGFEVRPNEFDDAFQPLHQVAIPNLGLTIGEMWDLEALAADCERDGVFEFLLVAPPGVGKSRLLYELSTIAHAERELITWRQGRCLAYGEGVTFWALAEIVKAQAGILEADDEETVAGKLRQARRRIFEREQLRRETVEIVDGARLRHRRRGGRADEPVRRNDQQRPRPRQRSRSPRAREAPAARSPAPCAARSRDRSTR